MLIVIFVNKLLPPFVAVNFASVIHSSFIGNCRILYNPSPAEVLVAREKETEYSALLLLGTINDLDPATKKFDRVVALEPATDIRSALQRLDRHRLFKTASAKQLIDTIVGP